MARSKKTAGDPVKAWAACKVILKKERNIRMRRGKGGFRRVAWEEVLETHGSRQYLHSKKIRPRSRNRVLTNTLPCLC
jgi:nitrate reductase alpha subunit